MLLQDISLMHVALRLGDRRVSQIQERRCKQEKNVKRQDFLPFVAAPIERLRLPFCSQLYVYHSNIIGTSTLLLQCL